MPFYRAVVVKTYLVVVQTDNLTLAQQEALNAVKGQTGQRSHVFDTMINVESVAVLSVGQVDDV